MTTRSGLRKSSIAAPSLRNSGFETTSNSRAVTERMVVADLVGGAHGDRGLHDDDAIAIERASDLLRRREDVPEVGRAVGLGRRADADEDEESPLHRLVEVRGELEPLLLDVALDQLLETGLVDRDLARAEEVDLLLVEVDAGDIVPGLGEARSRDEADVPGPNDGDFHINEAPLAASPFFQAARREIVSTEVSAYKPPRVFASPRNASSARESRPLRAPRGARLLGTPRRC